MSECHCEKKKHRCEQEKTDLSHRLHRIEGQIRGLSKMVAEDRYCIDILTQVSAVHAALHSFEKELLSSHVRTCLTESIQKGETDLTEELLRVLPQLMK